MSTMAPEATAVVSASPLITRFWLKLQAKAIAAGGAVTSPIRTVLSKLFSWVPAPIKALAGPVLMLTPFGYDALWAFLTTPVRAAWWLAKKAATLSHRVIEWAGNRVVDLVALFSEERSVALAVHVDRFVDGLAKYGVLTRALIASIGTEIQIAISKPGPMIATMAAAGATVLTIAMKMVFPATFATAMFHLPTTLALFLTKVALGGWAAFNPIVLVSIASVGVVLALGLFARPAPIAAPEPPASEAVVEGEVLTGSVVNPDELVEIVVDGKPTTVTRAQAVDALNKAADAMPAGPGHQAKSGKGHKSS